MATATSKLTRLEEAVATHVGVGDHVHFASVGGRPNALIRSLISRHWAEPRSAGLTISATAVGGNQLGLALLSMGSVRRVIAGYVGHQYPTPGPAAVAREALASGVSFELWSLLTLIQRLRAGAMGWDWTPTVSLADGSLPSIREALRRVSVDGEELMLLPALRPDVTFVHTIIADERGNAVLPPPYTEGLTGVLAASRGVVVTAEKIVSEADIRRHGHLPTVPESVVLSVSEAPLGAHPGPLYADGVDPGLSYSDDYEFLVDFRTALEAPRAEREDWIAKHLAGPADHAAYVDGLGSARVEHLHTGWRLGNSTARSQSAAANGTTKTERMILAAATFLRQHVRRTRPRFIFAGIGASSLAAWTARQGDDDFPTLISEMGFYDYDPQLGDPWLFAVANMATCSTLTDTETILGSLVQGHASSGLAVLATAQLDRFGRLNTSFVGDHFITGSGGANDATSAIGEVIVVVPHDRTRLVTEVDYVTSPGVHTVAAITDRAVLVRTDGDFRLEAVVRSTDTSDDLREAAAAIAADTPWPLHYSDSLRFLDPVDNAALRILRDFDPRGYFLSDPVRKQRSS